VERQGKVLRRLWTEESGISLAEVLVASAMASIIATAFLVVFSAFSRGVSLEEERSAALTEAQGAMTSLSAELRQAVRLVPDGPLIEVLESAAPSAELIFYSDRAEDAPGPERYRYVLADCTATHCNLMREVTVADGSAPPWTYSGVPTSRRVISDIMIGGGPIFLGSNWRTGTEVETSSCNTNPRCRFDLVEIELRIDPDPNAAAEEPLLVRNEVRLRNAR